MDSSLRQYIFGIFFIGFGIYQMILGDYLEFSLYAAAGGAFIFNTFAKEPKLEAYKSVFVFLTWGLIIVEAVMFFYVLQFNFLKLF
jgi:hypothetical protein